MSLDRYFHPDDLKPKRSNTKTSEYIVPGLCLLIILGIGVVSWLSSADYSYYSSTNSNQETEEVEELDDSYKLTKSKY